MNEEKIELSVLGIAHNSTQNNTFVLILKEVHSNRNIPIIIGAFEAQAIAMEIEKARPPRPMAHDVIREIIFEHKLKLTEVLLYDLIGETYFSKLIFDEDNITIDCRPSDAVAIALKCDVPIYALSFILDEVEMIVLEKDPNIPTAIFEPNKPKGKLEQLQKQLERAVNNEDYEAAAKLRDEIKLYLDN